MKKVLLLLLLFPVISFGQKVELSGMVGYGIGETPGLGTRYSVGYYISPKVSVHGVYATSNWNSIVNEYGITAEVHFDQAYVGGGIYSIKANAYYSGDSLLSPAGFTSEKFSPGYLTGVFAGGKEKIVKHVYIKGEIGIGYEDMSSTVHTASSFGDNTYSSHGHGMVYRAMLGIALEF